MLPTLGPRRKPDQVDALSAFGHADNMNRRIFFYALLSALLFFGQQGAAVHALSHLAEKLPAHSEQDKNLPHSPVCDKCVVYAGIGSAAPSSPLTFAIGETAGIPAAMSFLLFFSPPLHSYFSRAPPRLACLAVFAA